MPAADTVAAFRHAHWHQYRRVPNQILNQQGRGWVLASGSLTKRLILASHGDFRVLPRRQYWARPWTSEQRALGLAPGQFALIREVALIGCNETWVEARTVIPAATLTGARRRLAHLGTTPLGAYLFKCRTMRRAPLQIATRPLDAPTQAPSWGRRSLFFLDDCPLLVSEFFLPALFSRPAAILASPGPR